MRPRRLPLVVFAGLIALFAVPLATDNDYVLALGISFAAMSVLAGGLNLIYGYTGLLSFAQVGFFGIGAYTAVLLVVDLDWSLWAAVAAGAALCVAVGLLVGYSSLRLSRHAFAIVSLSFALLCAIVARDWPDLTRGSMGIPGLPTPTLALPGLRWRIADPSDYYYLLMGFAVIAHGLIYVVVTSRLGRAMRAIKLNEPLAQSQGVNPLSYRLLALSLSAALSGIVGGLFVFYLTIIDPSIFDFYYTETMLISVVIGGPGSFWGVLLASAVMAALLDLLRFTTDLRMVLYGVALIVAMLVFPGGIGGWVYRRRVARWRRPQSQQTIQQQPERSP